MAIKITEDCTNCFACEPECPNGAITEGSDQFDVDPNKCTECVGFHNEAQCAKVCPVDCCVPDEQNVESESSLIEKLKILYPDKNFDLNSMTSKYRK